MKDSVQRVPIGDICDFVYGSSLPERLRRTGNIPVYGSNGIVGLHDESLTSGPTIIIGRKGSIGEVHYSPVPCFPIDTTYFVSDTKIPCDLKWLTHILRCLRLPDLNKSSAVPGLNRQDAYEKRIALPPLPIQKRIAAILEKADAAREKRLQTIDLTEKLLQSAFLDMFGDPVTNPKGWEKVKAKELFEIQLGKMLSARNYTGKNLRPYLRNLNVQWGRLDLSDVKQMDFDEREFAKYRLRKGDILVCEGGEVGRTGIYNGEIDNCCFQNALHRLTILNSNIASQYFLFYMRFAAMRGMILSQTSTVTIAHFTAEKFKEFGILLPPFALQQKFAALVEKVETMRAKQHTSEQELENLFQSLMQKAFKGELVS